MTRTTMALAGVLILLGAGAAQAQPPRPEAAEGGGMHMRMTPPDPARMAGRLRDALQLRPDQEAALQAFVAAERPPAAMGEPMMGEGGGPESLTTPQRLDRMKARMAQMEARFDAHAAAVRRFYAQLSPAQQKAFDALGARAGGGPGMHMRMHAMMRPGGAMHGGREGPPPER